MQCADIQYRPSVNLQACRFCVDEVQSLGHSHVMNHDYPSSEPPSSQLVSRLSDTDVWLHDSTHIGILIPVTKVKIDEEREKMLVKEELGRKLGICIWEVEDKGDSEADGRVEIEGNDKEDDRVKDEAGYQTESVVENRIDNEGNDERLTMGK